MLSSESGGRRRSRLFRGGHQAVNTTNVVNKSICGLDKAVSFTKMERKSIFSMSAQAAFAPSVFGVASIPKPRLRKKPVVVTKTSQTVTKARPAVKKAQTQNLIRTSQLLRNLLANNPAVQNFTVEKIVSEIGSTSFGTSLMFFAIPEVLPIPVPGVSAIVVLPTGVISAQMAAGKKQITLPRFLLKRTVPRKALVTAIRAILPVLERAERATKPRWKWASSPAAQRALGVFIFLLAMAIAVPIPGFNMPQAIAIFTIGLGLVEKDGMLICAGVVIGLASLLLLGGVLFGISSFLGFGKA